MQDQLQKAIILAKKTGDRLIIFDPSNVDSTYVVMPLEHYERLVIKKSEVKGLTEQELLDRINRDIAIWKSEQDFVNCDSKDVNFKEATANLFSSIRPNLPRDDRGGVSAIYDQPMVDFKSETIIPQQETKSKWNIPSTRKQGAEEIIDEDTHYLEEITF